MCGIAGWMARGQRAPARVPDVEAMAAALRHRGPDDDGKVSFTHAGLGFRRLALLDLEGGHQPMTDERGRIWSVFNGEIYNHADLARELAGRGHVIRGHGDSELLPHLYEEWGPDFVTRLRGMFAIAIYDVDEEELFLARDPFGIKPLYYADTGEALVFGSEARALAASGAVTLQPDPASVWHYLSFGYPPDPMTMWAGVHKLPPGHHLRVSHGRSRLERYWEPRFRPAPDRPLRQVSEEIEAALDDSVRTHLLADVPVGAYLSSGVDSSYLVALASRAQPLHTFSIGFEGSEDDKSEVEEARALARVLGTEHHEEIVSAAEYRASLPMVVASQEEPLADPSAPALWFLARSAARHVKAVLSGEGADELFAGYPIYQEPAALRSFARLPGPLVSPLRRAASTLPDGMRGKGFVMRGTTGLERRFLGNTPLFSEHDKRELMGEAFGGRSFPVDSWKLVEPVYRATASEDAVIRMQTVSCHTWLPGSILMKADKMSMAHSLEVRVPFLDREVFAVAATVPLAYRVSREGTKLALRAAAGGLVPAATAARPKLGFPVPFRAWLDEELGILVRDLVAGAGDSLLDRRAIERVVAAKPRPGYFRRIWTILMYLLWVESLPTLTAPTG